MWGINRCSPHDALCGLHGNLLLLDGDYPGEGKDGNAEKCKNRDNEEVVNGEEQVINNRSVAALDVLGGANGFILGECEEVDDCCENVGDCLRHGVSPVLNAWGLVPLASDKSI